MEEGLENGGRNNGTTGRGIGGQSSLGSIKHFPAGFSRSQRFSEGSGGSAEGPAREHVGHGELSPGGTSSTSSGDRASNGDSGQRASSARRGNQRSKFPDRGIRNTARNHGNDATIPQTIGIERNGTGSSGTNFTSIHEQLSQEQLVAPLIETHTPLDLPVEGVIEPTKMLQREMDKGETAIVIGDGAEDVPAFAAPETKSAPKKSKPVKGKSPVVVQPGEDFKFDKQTRVQLTEWFVWTSKGIDMGVDYGFGLDTEMIPIWELTEEDADVFVRILERRAGRSEYVRDTVVPKMLASRDYIEAGMLLAPRFIATVKGVVDQGGPKPHIPGKRVINNPNV